MATRVLVRFVAFASGFVPVDREHNYVEADQSTPMRFAHDQCLPPEEFDIRFMHDHRTGELIADQSGRRRR